MGTHKTVQAGPINGPQDEIFSQIYIFVVRKIWVGLVCSIEYSITNSKEI